MDTTAMSRLSAPWRVRNEALSSSLGPLPHTRSRLRISNMLVERGTWTAMHKCNLNPNAKRPFALYRNPGVMSDARASAVLDGYFAREWVVFPVPGSGRKATHFTARRDADSCAGHDCCGGRVIVNTDPCTYILTYLCDYNYKR